MSNVAIRVENLSKSYRIGGLQRADYRTLRESVADMVKGPFRRASKLLRGQAYGAAEMEETIWALKEVSFDVRRGEVVGIIGRNGAGKTTLLKILSRITEPTQGEAWIRGRVGSLLEVGTGFHGELTGRENVYLNGAILGMKRAEIEARFEEIVEFSGIGQFIDTPVKHYSSGMQVRLAFSVAAHLEPEILLVDEVLAVGDIGFRRKCIGRMGDVARSGRTVLFVSHNLAAVENLCTRAVLLERGCLVANGDVSEVISQYVRTLDSATGTRDLSDPGMARKGSGEAVFQAVEIRSLSGQDTSTIPVGEGVIVRLRVLAHSRLRDAEIGVGLFSVEGLRFCGFNSRDLGNWTLDLDAEEEAVVDCKIPRMNIAPGVYTLNLLIRKQDRRYVDFVERAVSFDIVPNDFFGTGRIPKGRNLVFLDVDWSYRRANDSARTEIGGCHL